MQLSALGRRLTGRPDALAGYARARVRIEDPAVAASLGRTHHANLERDANALDPVSGTVFDVTDAELARIDGYEAAFLYVRVTVTLASGRGAWLYVHAHA